jgi:predicted dehydrogenase
VFCEKPLAVDLADCDAMIAACDAAGVVFMTGQVLRFYACHELGKKLVDEGAIGDLVYIETDYAWSFRGGRSKPASWYGTVGGFLENGIHKADLINWFGGLATSVSAEVGSWSGHDDWEDYAITLIRFASGCVGTLRWGSFMGARSNTDTLLDGTKGSLRISIQENRVWQKLLGEEGWTEQVPDGPVGAGVANELRHFVECIETGAPCRADGREGRRAVELVLASYRSAREGTKVTLPL